MLLKFIEIIYIIYIIIFFKTKYSFHHLLEIEIQNGKYWRNVTSFIKHPINTEVYENKICPLGHLTAVLLVIWIITRSFLSKNPKYINLVIWIIILISGFILNINFFIYLLPAFIIDVYIVNKDF